MNREAQILQALQSDLPLAARKALVVELNSIRARAAQRVATAREVELGKEAAAAHLTPAPTYVRHTSDTDWLGRVATVRESAAEIHQKAKMEASAWMRQVSALARADHEELRIQAVGYAQVWGSQFGELATVARDSFLQTASHIAGVKLAADDEEPEDDEADDSDEAYEEADDSDGGNPFADDSDEEDTKKESRRVVAARPLYEIAQDIRRDWGANVNYAAKPYLDAMRELTSITDQYYEDSAKSIVAYFLSNASSWRGETAKAIKAELKALLSGKTASKHLAGNPHPVGTPAWFDWENDPDAEGKGPRDSGAPGGGIPLRGPLTPEQEAWMNKGRKKAEWEATQCSRCGGNNGGGNDRCAHCGAVMDPNPKRKATLHTAWSDDDGPALYRDALYSAVGKYGTSPTYRDAIRKALETADEQLIIDMWSAYIDASDEINPSGLSMADVAARAVVDLLLKRNMKGASLHLAADTDISNFLVHQYPSKNPVYFTYQKDRGLYVHHYPLTHRGDQRLVLYSSGDSGIGQQIDEVRLPAGQAPDDAIRSMLGIGKAASRRTAEADGIDSPSPDSQNGYAESTLPNVEVATAPEDTNMGWIAEGDPNAVTASMGVFEAMFMRGATDQVTSGPLYDAAGKDASLGVGHVWTNTSCPAYRSYDPKDCICKKTAARKTADIVEDVKRFINERWSGLYNVGRDKDVADGQIWRGTLHGPGGDPVFVLVKSDGTMVDMTRGGENDDGTGNMRTSTRKHAEADGIDSPSPDSQNGYAESTLPNVEVSTAPEDTNLGWITDGDPNAQDEGSFDAPDNPIANEASRRTASEFSDHTPNPGWGKPYGGGDPNYMTPRGPVWMFRKGQSVRFYDITGAQVGPEQSNVAPAVAYAHSEDWEPYWRYNDDSDYSSQPGWNQAYASRRTAGKAYDKGMADGKIGDGIQYNPYPFDSSDGAEWIRGYRDAQGLQPGQKASSHKQAGDNDRPAGAAPMVDTVMDESDDDVDMFGGEWVHEGSRRQALHPDDDPSQGPGYLDDAPDYLGDPPGMDPTSFGDFDMFAPEEPKQASRKQAMPAPADLGVSVGSIFYSSWGYDQTNVSFYEVVGLTPASVKIREVAKSYVEQNGPAGNKVIPQPGNYIGGEMTKRLQNSGFRDAAITINSSETAWLWDGKPQYETDSVYGH